MQSSEESRTKNRKNSRSENMLFMNLYILIFSQYFSVHFPDIILSLLSRYCDFSRFETYGADIPEKKRLRPVTVREQQIFGVCETVLRFAQSM